MPAGRIRRIVLVGLAYYVAGRAGLLLSLVGDNVTPLWPPTGIAVAAFICWGRQLWPGVALAAFALNAPTGAGPWAAVGIALGNTLAPFLASWLLERIGFRRQLDRQRDAISIVVVALGAMLVSASIGTSVLAMVHPALASDHVTTWAVWWTGDAMGVLVITPFLLSLPLFRELPAWTWWQWSEAVVALVAVAVATSWAGRTLNVLFLALPIVGWTAWRLQLRGAAPAALVASGIATWSAARGLGPFQDAALLSNMLILLAFNASVALMSFVLAAIVSERNQAESALMHAAEDLEARVQARTNDLAVLNRRLRAEIRERSATQRQLSQEEARSQRGHDIAVTLQRTLLPSSLPEVPGLAVAARYVPATSDVQIGGDWYDVLTVPGGHVAVVIGDVAGHGLDAAASMAQLRMAVRVFALQDPSPVVVLRGIQRLVAQLGAPELVTILYALLDPASGQLRYASAGHPPALVVGESDATYLTGALVPPIGVAAEQSFLEATHELPRGSTLLLYTDGLVERRGVSITDGLEHLSGVASAAAGTDLEQLCDDILASLLTRDHVADDVALVALRPLRLGARRLHLEVPAEAVALARTRAVLRHWLREVGASADEENDVLVATGEACANVVQHAYAALPGQLVIEADADDGSIEIRVTDHGRWRAPGNRGGGWGLTLMRALTDSVQVDQGPTGTVVRLRKGLDVRVGEPS